MTEAAPAADTLLDAPSPDAADPKDTSLLDKPKETPAGSDSPDAPKADPSKADPAKSEPAKPVVPESYEIKLPDGQTLNPEFKKEFDEVAKGLGLTQENYQKLVDMQSKFTDQSIKTTMDVFQKQIDGWAEETKKELGAEPEKALAVASKAIDRIFSDPKENADFRDMMKTTGLGNWKLMVKAFTYVGKAISDDKFVEGQPNAGKPKRSAEEVLFDHPSSVAAMKESAQK